MGEINHSLFKKIPTHAYSEENTVSIPKLGNSYCINNYIPDSAHYSTSRDSELEHHDPLNCPLRIIEPLDIIVWLKLCIERYLDDSSCVSRDTREYALYLIDELLKKEIHERNK